MSIQPMINVADVNPRQFKLSPQIYMDLLTGCKSTEEYLPHILRIFEKACLSALDWVFIESFVFIIFVFYICLYMCLYIFTCLVNCETTRFSSYQGPVTRYRTSDEGGQDANVHF